MALWIKKPMVFLLAITLLMSSSSYAWPSLSPFFEKIPQSATEAGKGLKSSFGRVDATNPVEQQSSVRGVFGANNAKALEDPSHFIENEPTELDPFNGLAQKVGEWGAKRFLGKDGLKGFRWGWKNGKRYYSVAHKCEKIEQHLTCLQASPPCESNTQCEGGILAMNPICVAHCVIAVAESVTKSNPICYEECGVPPETPYTYCNGIAIRGACSP